MNLLMLCKIVLHALAASTAGAGCHLKPPLRRTLLLFLSRRQYKGTIKGSPISTQSGSTPVELGQWFVVSRFRHAQISLEAQPLLMCDADGIHYIYMWKQLKLLSVTNEVMRLNCTSTSRDFILRSDQMIGWEESW